MTPAERLSDLLFKGKGKKGMEDTKGREFHIAEQVADLLDTLNPEQQRQVMTMLATRYGLTIKEPSQPGRGSSYRPNPRKTRW